MARVVVTTLTCDLCGDGTEAEGTVVFAFDGSSPHEMDLCTVHLEECQETVDLWTSVARPAEANARNRPATAVTSNRTKAGRERMRRIREWAWENGFPDLAERGRVPDGVVQAYEEANSA